MRLPTQLLRRRLKSNKGDFGHIFILAGSAGFSGAAVLCSFGAIRTGAGLVTLGISKGINSAIIRIKPLEVMTLSLPETSTGSISLKAYEKIEEFSKKVDLVIIGPGLTQDKSTQSLIRKLVAEINKPLIIDADGLNALVGNLNLLPPDSILTPHPGEMARLLGINAEEIQKNRKEIARKFSKKYRVVLVLKGHETIVSDYSGDLYINKTGNSGMATAGSGDVLTGMIGAFLGQGLKAFKAAKYAVYLHGLAGDLAAEEKTQISLIASDIIDKIPSAIKKIS
jgi:NAD(P)H-hydrate epimerase